MKLQRIDDEIILAITNKSKKTATDYANATEGNFKQEDIEAIQDNTYWLIAQAQLSSDKAKLKELFAEIDSHGHEGTHYASPSTYDKDFAVFKEKEWWHSLKKEWLE